MSHALRAPSVLTAASVVISQPGRDTLIRNRVAPWGVRVFLALPDHGLAPEVERALRDGLAEAKHDVLADAPGAHAGLLKSERERFLATVDRMMEADALAADVSEPDAGVGWCVAWFLARGRLVVLTCRRNARASAPAMLVGNPSPWQRIVLYDDANELRRALATELAR